MAWTNIENGESMASVRTKLNELGSSGGGVKYIDIELVGGGGGGASITCGNERYGLYGAGGGGMVSCQKYIVGLPSYCIKIGSGAVCVTNTHIGLNGGDTSFGCNEIIAYGGGGVSNMKATGGGGCGNTLGYGQGYGGGFGAANSTNYCSGNAGGGAGGCPLCYPGLTCMGYFYPGTGRLSIINGNYYGAGASGMNCNGCSWTTCGTGNCGEGGKGKTAGKNGIALIRYKTNGEYGIKCATGGTKTTSGDYTIHTFTSNGTFTIVS